MFVANNKLKIYKIKAITKFGNPNLILKENQVITVHLLARGKAEAHEILKLLKLKPKGKLQGKPFKNLSLDNLIAFFIEFNLIAKSTLTLDNQLAQIFFLNKKEIAATTSFILWQLNQGYSLVQSFENSKCFPKIILRFLSAGNYSKNLIEINQLIINFLKNKKNNKTQLINLFIYPTFVGLSILFLIFFMFTTVVPQLEALILQLQFTSNITTTSLFYTANFITNNYYIILLSIFITTLIYCLANSFSLKMHFIFKKINLAINPISITRMNFSLSHHFLILAIFLRTDKSLESGLQDLINFSDNIYLKKQLTNILLFITKGDNIYKAFANSTLGNQNTWSTLQSAQSRADLSLAFLSQSEYFGEIAENKLNKIKKSLSPSLTILLGTFLIWIILGVFVPMYEMIGTIA